MLISFVSECNYLSSENFLPMKIILDESRYLFTVREEKYDFLPSCYRIEGKT